MQKAHPTLPVAQRSSLREASRAGRFAKRWHLSSRPRPRNAAARFTLRASPGRKM